MKKFILILLLFPLFATAQNRVVLLIKNEITKEIVPGATAQIKNLNISATGNQEGLIYLDNIPDGKYEILISYTGFTSIEKNVVLPSANKDALEIFLKEDADELEEVTISSTRAGRSINKTPTRVEVIGAEEIHEEATMRPGDIRMLLAESTGIQVQQTSATAANSSIRIQGLDGRYTQILKDGFPVYAGAATGLGLLQTPPADLKQVEIIKGSSSTLYGGGAIAGMINLITKSPSVKPELSFHINGTSGGGLDVNTFYGKRFKKTGVTILASENINKAFDPAGISLTAIPKFDRFTFNPKIFFYPNDATNLNFGINSTFENRIGGDVFYIKGNGDSTHSYFEKNKTKRLSTQFTFNRRFNERSSMQLKNSISYYHRTINSKGYGFSGKQVSSFTEADYLLKQKNSDWSAGVNFLTDAFKEDEYLPLQLRNYNQTTYGAFVQNTQNITDWFTLETGLRGDYVKDYGFALLPRMSALFKINKDLTSRAGFGFGYKTPNIFTEESEKYLYRNISPINSERNSLEKSYGVNADVNYKFVKDEVNFSINQFFFYTYLNHPLILNEQSTNLIFENIPGHLSTKGAETNIRLAYDEMELYLGYTYTDAEISNNGIKKRNPLTPNHRFNAALVYEIEGKWRFGSELYYYSKQLLNDGRTGRDYWLTGFVAERKWKKNSVYINFENLGDVRQTKFENIYSGSLTNPVFKDIYAPLEGFVVNAGIILKL